MSTTWQTPRLTLRRFRHDDFDDLYALQCDPEATRFIGGVWTPEKTREVLDGVIKAYDTGELEWFAVADRAGNRVLGVCWLGQLNRKWSDPLGWGPEVELGYRYARRYWNQGYATEAGAEMLRRGFEELNLPSIVAIVDVDNKASERVLQKLGMTYETSGIAEGYSLLGYRITRQDYRHPPHA